MSDIDIEVLSKYDIKINRTYKGRGCIICESEGKNYKLLPYAETKCRLSFEADLLNALRNAFLAMSVM